MNNKIFMKQYIILLLLLLTVGVGKASISGSPVISGDVYAGAAGINSKSTYQMTTNASYVYEDNPFKEMAMVIGNTNLSIKGTPTITGNIYGGTVTENVFGDGDAAKVAGNTKVQIGEKKWG